MPGAAYFWRQADICLRMSLVSSDADANRWVLMAKEYEAKAIGLEAASMPPRAEAVGRTVSGGETGRR
jgi:hypothetical protein